jgi:hypothetical protein
MGGLAAARTTTQRRWPRFRRRLRLTYHVDHASWHRGSRDGFTTDAGPRGMCVSSPFVPAPGSRLRIEVELPGMGIVEMWGNVAWHETSSSGSRSPSTFGVVLSSAGEAWFQYWLRASS